MFTGIIESVGVIESSVLRGDSFSITVRDALIAEGSGLGDSVAVNGVCLTVCSINGESVGFDAVRETVSRTTVSEWKTSRKVNLERAVTPETRLGGHIVQGHVDGTAVMLRAEENRTGTDLWFKAEGDYLSYLVPKGSIAVDGVSLTIAELKEKEFRVSLVPFTLANTTLNQRKNGDKVNIETDIIGRYVERFMQLGNGEGLTAEKLLRSGFSTRNSERGTGN